MEGKGSKAHKPTLENIGQVREKIIIMGDIKIA